jgi:phage tail-like protein
MAISLADLTLHTAEADPPISHNFAVMLDAVATVQMWTSVNGLALSLQAASSRQKGGKGTTPHNIHQAPTKGALSTPGKLELTRPLGPASQAIYNWCAKSNTRGQAVNTTNGMVILLDRTSMMIYEWDLTGIVPVSWTVGKMDASQSSIVTETLSVSYATMTFKVSILN